MTGRYVKAVIVIGLIMLITACSFKTVYNRLDYLIPKYVEGVVSLDDILEERLEGRTQVLLNWHRNTQLKQYAGWLQSLQPDIGVQLTEQQLEQHISEMEGFWLSLLNKVNDEMAYLLPMLDEVQREELFVYLDDSNEEFRESFIEPEDQERIDDYAGRMIDVYEDWIGELTDEQAGSVEQAAAELISSAELRLQRRLEWQQGIRQILVSADSPYDKSQRLRVFLAGFEQDQDGPIRQASDINRQVIIRLTVHIAHSLTNEQREFFISRTDDYIRMFTELAENR
ncbi:MAG: hypothetical protein KJP10_01645 [Gammaproteobacteria bacterium]|nr:hypothetical protein [Gammaproteobacteria bacterium]